MKYHSILFGGLIGSIAWASPALADTTNGYGVNTATVAGEEYGLYNTVSTYRTVTDAALAYTMAADWAPGFPATQQYTACPITDTNISSYYNCTGTNSGTISHDNNLLFSENRAIFTDTDGRLGDGQAYADLESRQLGVSAHTTYGAGAYAFAQWNDLFTLNVGDATSSTVTPITVIWEFDGNLISPGGSNYTVSRAYGQLNVNDAWAQASYSDNAFIPNVGGLPETSFFIAPYWDSYSWISQTPALTRFTGTLNVTGANPTLNIANRLQASAQFGAQSLFLSTSHFSLIVPSNVTYTTASGFSSVPESAVPEPATWAMILSGFGLMGATLRRRKQTIRVRFA